MTDVIRAQGVERVPPPSGDADEASVRDLVTGLAGFGHDLLHLVASGGVPVEDTEPAGEVRSDPGNLVLSPLSIGYAFGMVAAGAVGDTRAEIERTFGFDGDAVHAAFNALTSRVVRLDGAVPRAADGSDRPDPPVVGIANGLFIHRAFADQVEPGYLTVLAAQYDTGLRTLDFAAADHAVEVINSWVAEQTAGRIERLIDGLDPDARLVLANAVYLKADWAWKFEPAATREEPFHRVFGGPIEVPMMRQEGWFGYSEGDGWQAVELPYVGNELAMRVLVPAGAAENADPLRAVGLLAPGGPMTAEPERRRVDLQLPRWDFATRLGLGDALADLGMPTAFDPDRADLGRIAPSLYVAAAMHRANITVDENGTEAAAATGIQVGTTSLPPPAEVRVCADRPFGFSIVHRPTGAPLFVGVVTDPRASQ